MALVSQPGRHTQWKKVLTHTQSRRYFSKLIRNSAQLLLLNHNTRFSTIFNYAFCEEFLNLVTYTHSSSFSDKLWCMNKSSSQNLGNKFLSGSCDILYGLLPSMSESNLGALLKIILLMYQPFYSEVIFILFGCNCFDTINHFLILQCDNDSMNAFPMHFLNRKFDRPWISYSLPCYILKKPLTEMKFSVANFKEIVGNPKEFIDLSFATCLMYILNNVMFSLAGSNLTPLS